MHTYTSLGIKVFHFHNNQNFISVNEKRSKASKSLAFLLQSVYRLETVGSFLNITFFSLSNEVFGLER